MAGKFENYKCWKLEIYVSILLSLIKQITIRNEAFINIKSQVFEWL